MSDAYTIKTKVRDLIAAALPDFTLTWGFTTREPPRKWVYMGKTTWPQAEWATNRSRQLTLNIPIVLNVLSVKQAPEDAEKYVWDQLIALQQAFGPDSTMRDAGAITWGLAPVECGTQPSSDGGIEAQLAANLTVEYRP